jgi:hypothetical protein
MKKKKFNKKLALNKKTIANLNPAEMNAAYGGDVWTYINPPYPGGNVPFTCAGHTCYADPENNEGLCVDPFAETQGALCYSDDCAN